MRQWNLTRGDRDAAHRVTEFTSLLDGTADYTYDGTDQLTGADYTYQGNEAYGYDANGNRTMTGYVTGDNNLVLSDGVYDYQYDSEGNRTCRTHIASGEVTDYDWDHRHRLTRVFVKTSDQGHLVWLRPRFSVPSAFSTTRSAFTLIGCGSHDRSVRPSQASRRRIA